jgi:hypothetical protein
LLSLQTSIFEASLFFRVLARCVLFLMNEFQRQAYLKVMDIQPFYLKKVLPAAKASPSYDYSQDIQELEGLASAQEPAKTAGVVSGLAFGEENLARDGNRPVGLSGLKAELRQATGKSLGKLARETEKPVEQDPSTMPSVAAEVEVAAQFNFKIRYFHINDQLAVIDELPYAKGDEGSDAKIALLKAILSALKVNWSDSDFRTESFSWPIESPMHTDGNSKLAAQQILKGFIAQRHGARKFSNLLVFAGQIEAILAESGVVDAGAGDGDGLQDFVQMPQGYHMTLTSTLSAMLSYPLLKKQVWAHLQPLKERLAAAV